jgi:uncharacterized DUF497 family protein
MVVEIERQGWRYKFDESKRQAVSSARQVDFEQALEIFDGHYFQDPAPLYPGQERATGFAKGALVTLIIEEREDDDGPYTWIVNAWKATAAERKKYEQSR